MFFGRKWFRRHFSLWWMWYYSRYKKFQAVLQLCHQCYRSLTCILKSAESHWRKGRGEKTLISYLQTRYNLVSFLKVQGSLEDLYSVLPMGSGDHIPWLLSGEGRGCAVSSELTPSAANPDVKGRACASQRWRAEKRTAVCMLSC